MSGIFKYPDPNTTAFGGVATGSMNAQLDAMPAPIIKAYGCTPIAADKDAIIGNIIVAVAVFDVISVKKITSVVTRSKIT
ncbi:hypothetical protein R0J90_14045, partial [Micrococcus sp. SIMBA_144]